MRIRELTVRNVKILADQTFSFVRPDGSLRTWTVLLGDNGVCKTTVLQAIALASSGDKMARKLVEDAADYVRQDSPQREAKQRGADAVDAAVATAHRLTRPDAEFAALARFLFRKEGMLSR